MNIFRNCSQKFEIIFFIVRYFIRVVFSGISNPPNASGDNLSKGPTKKDVNVDEFDMFAQSRNVTYESSKKT